MMVCKCGSFAINDDPAGILCDKCLRDAEILSLKAERDGLRKVLAELYEICKLGQAIGFIGG